MRAALVFLLLAVHVAHADPAPDATKAFTAFVESVATSKPATAGLDLFITPFREDVPVPADLGPVKKLLDKPKVKVSKLVVSKGGKSAWLAGEVTARVPHDGKLKSESLRASAMLSLDDGSWRVRATAWSAAVPNRAYEGCGNIEPGWHLTSDVPKDLAAPVKAVVDAFRAMPAADGMPGGDRGPLLKLLSDDPGALALGSAASERFAGGAAIKAVFKKWFITFGYGEGEDKAVPARAGIGAGGELMWMYIATMSNAQCTQYRTFLVLAKEKAGWRIVHQHYSEHILPP